MNHTFWTGGHQAYAKALVQEYQAEVAALQAELESCHDEAKKEEVKLELARMKTELEAKLGDSSSNIH